MNLYAKLAINLIILLSLYSTAYTENTVVAGKLNKNLISEISISHEDIYNMSVPGQIIDSVEIDTNGIFHFSIDVKEPGHYVLGSGGMLVFPQLYLWPGDSLFIDFNFGDQNLTFDFSGTGKSSIANNMIKDYNEKFRITPDQQRQFQDYLKNDTLHYFFDFITGRKDAQLKYIKSEFKGKKYPEMVKQDLKNSVIYDWASAMMNKIIRHLNYLYSTKKEYFDPWKDYKKIESVAILDNKEAASIVSYQFYVERVLTLKFMDWFIKQKLEGKEPEKLKSYEKIFELADNDFKGSDKDFAYKKAFNDFLNEIGSVDELNFARNKLEEYTKFDTSPDAIEAVKNLFNRDFSLLGGNPAPDFTLTDINGKKVSLSDFKGKLVYIDFWGTWCGPCRKELPYYADLQSKFKDNKDIVFMSVALERKGRQNWEDFVKGKNLPGVQLYVDGRKDKIGQLYKISVVPTFIIVDKDGNIVTTKAQRPSDKSLETTLKDLLK